MEGRQKLLHVPARMLAVGADGTSLGVLVRPTHSAGVDAPVFVRATHVGATLLLPGSQWYDITYRTKLCDDHGGSGDDLQGAQLIVPAARDAAPLLTRCSFALVCAWAFNSVMLWGALLVRRRGSNRCPPSMQLWR
jgi:hypothetical protein